MPATTLVLDHGRPFAEVDFESRSGARRALAWLDTGGGPLIVGAGLADDLGLVEIDDIVDGRPVRRVDLPPLRVAGIDLLSEPYLARRHDRDLIQEGFAADCFIPAHVLAAHTVVFDYPGRTLELGIPGLPTGRGEEVACPFRRRPGWPAMNVSVAGQALSLLVDTGASCCMLSMPVFDRITSGLPRGRKAVGAVGIANMSGGAWEASVPIARVPVLRFGPVELPDVVVVGRPAGNFETMMSSGTAVPVVGALAGNALQWARVELYAGPDIAYLEATPIRTPDAMSLVPLVLEAVAGAVRIHGVATRDGRRLVEGVQPGDALLTVDGHDLTSLPFSAVIDRLRGDEGDERTLEVERDGKVTELTAPVVRVV